MIFPFFSGFLHGFPLFLSLSLSLSSQTLQTSEGPLEGSTSWAHLGYAAGACVRTCKDLL